MVAFQGNLFIHSFFVLQPSAFEEKAIEKVDDLLESYMGIRDSELGMFSCVFQFLYSLFIF